MAVRVRYRPMELTTGVEHETFAEATHYKVLDDNTIELRERTESGRYRVVGHVHMNRWESVKVVEEAET